MILLVALVAAVTLTLRYRRDAKYTSAAVAVRVDPKERMRIVEMKAETVAEMPDSATGTPREHEVREDGR